MGPMENELDIARGMRDPEVAVETWFHLHIRCCHGMDRPGLRGHVSLSRRIQWRGELMSKFFRPRFRHLTDTGLDFSGAFVD